CGQSLFEGSQSQTVVMSGPGPAAAAPAPASRSQAETGILSPPPEGSQTVTWGMNASGQFFGPANLQPGTSFAARYRIEGLLGEGGMGSVYKAYDTELGRTVALKLVRPELASSPQAMQRFKQELLLASKISHKNILRIHDLGDTNGIKFITMAFVEGADLASVLEKAGRLPLERTLKFTRQLCAALDAAHSEGVVHRDLKPQNVLIDAADNVYVTDFGLAKSLEPEATMMTRTGQILGTPRYMSPEQVEAKDVDHRSDLYSLGLILYEMATDELPFRGESTLQLMYQRVAEPPKDPRTARPDLPAYLANIILKCLEKDPAKRYQSAREILADLEAEHAPPVSAPTGTKTISIQLPVARSWWKWAAGAAVLALALAAAVPGIRHRILPAREAARTAQPALRYLAVLPFRITGDEQNTRYIADGVVDSLSAKLAGLRNVYVAPANAVSAAKQTDPAKLARALGVKLLLNGTITSGANGAIAITVSLDDEANNGRSLLHQNFAGVRQDLLTLEDQIFGKLVSALEIKQTNEELARSTLRPTENISAYELYLRGRNQWRSFRTEKDLHNAMDLFDQAIKLDPRFALAYTGLADAERRMAEQTKDPVWTQQALGAAQQAQALNDNLPEVHFTLGSLYTDTGRSAEATAELERALQLAPNSDEALRRLGTAYLKAGRTREAIAAYRKAVAVNPYLWTNSNQLGSAYFQLGQNDEALQAFRRVTELQPDRPEGWANMGAVDYRLGKWNESLPMFQKAIGLQPKAPYYSNLGSAYFLLGRYSEAAAMFEKAASLLPNDADIRVYLADAYRWLPAPAKAAAAYDQAIALAYKGVQANPRDAQALGDLAISYAKKGDFPRALDFIGRARAIDGKNNWLMYEEATIRALAGQTSGALASLEEALRNGYSLEEAKTDPELKQLRTTAQFARLASEFARQAAR
ncbi:MAG TPA: tetratricopeptide repeat protein, partial [Bryobacteraceae bacterium]|nr:tetratricopeptide repeat protein [Bryobacteraceae bacterium]